MDKKKRPKETYGVNYQVDVGCGHIYVTTGRNEDGELLELLAHLGRAGGCAMSQLEGITRCISLGLKYGIPIEEFISELEFIRCPSPALDYNKSIGDSVEVFSCCDALAKVLKKELESSTIYFEGENE